MKLISYLVIVSFIVLSTLTVKAQKKDSTFVGNARGIVRDSLYNFILQSATVAIYKVKDSSLVGYRLSNNFGEFGFKELPVGVPLKIIVTFIGYKTHNQLFIISALSKQTDFKNINLNRTENNLDEVVISGVPPPVTMKGDTIEFNADAFALDKNAVAEDLLRRLPGITMWGDGKITFNGKQIRQVLVEGKRFFGGDPKIATQNIAKNAIDKVQIYRQPTSSQNSLDSLTDINIMLKKDKKFGHFGKLAAGYGTRDHFESDANLNYFNSKTQVGITGAGNDINKTAGDAGTLMRNSSFKGVGANIEYQPDFSLQGINTSKSGGLVLQHDFIPVPDSYNNNSLTANAFVTDIDKAINKNTQSIFRLNADSTQIQQSSSNEILNTKRQKLDMLYDKRKDQFDFYASIKANRSEEHGENSVSSSANFAQGTQSTNESFTTGDRRDRNLDVQAGLRHNGSRSGIINPFNDYNVNYSLNSGNVYHKRAAVTQFTSLVEPSQNKLFDRIYDNNYNETKQHLDLALGNILAGLIPYQSLFGRISLRAQNNLDVSMQHQRNDVKDKNPVFKSYLNTPFLTNDMRTTTINERPALVIGRDFQRSLSERYIKSLSLRFNAEAQIVYQQNTSTQQFQSFVKNYRDFIPKASITYTNNQFGDFEDSYDLSFASAIDYPSVQQLFPLVDNSNPYYIFRGNPNLRPATSNTVSFDFRHISRKSNNTFNFDLRALASVTRNSFSDSVITDITGSNTYYSVNASGRKSVNISGNLNKAFKFTNHQVQLNVSTDLNIIRNPGYINSEFVPSRNLSNTNRLNLYYTFRDRVAFNVTQGYSYYRSKQSSSNNNEFRSNTLPTALSISGNFTKRLSLYSNITYNRFTSTGSPKTDFTIWNVSATYRFMQGNNLELKLAVLDLLHQNTSIINYVNRNVIVRGQTDVLRQYGMVTLAYYPRKFGKSK
jgi:hypothetical protein